MAQARDILTAAGNTLNLVVLGTTGVVTAATVGMPPIAAAAAAVGTAAYLALVAWDVVSKPKVSRVPAGPPLPEGLADPVHRAVVVSMRQARQQVTRVVDELPSHVLESIAPALGSVVELERHTGHLIQRSEELYAYLQTQDLEAVRKEYRQLGQAAGEAKDKDAREEYRRAGQAKEQQLRALEDLVAARERIHANLSRLVATLDALPPRLVRLKTLDEAALGSVGDDVSRELDQMNHEIRVFEQTLQSLLEPG